MTPRLIAALAARDLLRDRFVLVCNVAIIAGVLVPLLVLFGVKNGVYEALLTDLTRQPAIRQIDTAGNHALRAEDIAALADWPEIAFLSPRPRSQFDLINLRAEGGRRMRVASAVPSGLGDPNLRVGTGLAAFEAAMPARLAEQIGAAPGQMIELVTQAEGRPRQLVLRHRLVALSAADDGSVVLVPFQSVDLIEAFYDGYALPEHGIEAGRPLAERQPVFAGLRVHARELDQVAPLQRRIEDHLGIATSARSREIEATLGFGRNLDLALGLTVAIAAGGMLAALVLGFGLEVRRKQQTLAMLGLMGVPARLLALFPLVQAALTAAVGLALTWGLYALASRLATALFGTLPRAAEAPASLTLIRPSEGLAISGAVLACVVGAAGWAAWQAMRQDPASVLRQGGS